MSTKKSQTIIVLSDLSAHKLHGAILIALVTLLYVVCFRWEAEIHTHVRFGFNRLHDTVANAYSQSATQLLTFQQNYLATSKKLVRLPCVQVSPTLYTEIPIMNEKNYSIAIYVRSAPSEAKMRTALRQTWVREARQLGMFVLFVAALSRNETDQKNCEQEAELQGDILMFNNFIDAYHNLSLKTLETMRWHLAIQPTDWPTIVLSTNMDGMIFPKNLIHYIDTRKVHKRKGVIHGQCTCSGRCKKVDGPTPIRNSTGKWYMPRHIYPYKKYPHYCMGYSVMYSPGCVELLVAVANTRTRQYLMDMWIDDVTFSGVFAHETNLTLRSYKTALANAFVGREMTGGCKTCVAMHVKNKPGVIHKQYTQYLKHSNATYLYLTARKPPHALTGKRLPAMANRKPFVV